MTFLGENIPIAAEVSRAARETLRLDTDEPTVLGYYPVARMNPFQELLYSGSYAAGAAVVPLVNRKHLPVLEAAVTMGARAILHLHWTSEVLRDARTAAHAESLRSQFILELERIKDLGIRLVWTVHNALPHTCTFPEQERALRNDIAALTDAIHIMNPQTVAEVSEQFVIPEDKVFASPHPSYSGFYPEVDRTTARFELGFGPHDIVVGTIGSITHYKGLETLVAGIDTVSLDEPRLCGLIAGIPGADSESLIESLSQSRNVTVIARKLTDRDIAKMTTALDYMALPYERTLNSGASALAATFGIPIIAPTVGAFEPMIEAGLGVGYDGGDPDGLQRAMRTGITSDPSTDGWPAQTYLESIHPTQASRQFFDGVSERMR
jgi:beta-1,4-mannosyltransferase